jgi:hypothetical protein
MCFHIDDSTSCEKRGEGKIKTEVFKKGQCMSLIKADPEHHLVFFGDQSIRFVRLIFHPTPSHCYRFTQSIQGLFGHPPFQGYILLPSWVKGFWIHSNKHTSRSKQHK